MRISPNFSRAVSEAFFPLFNIWLNISRTKLPSPSLFSHLKNSYYLTFEVHYSGFLNEIIIIITSTRFPPGNFSPFFLFAGNHRISQKISHYHGRGFTWWCLFGFKKVVKNLSAWSSWKRIHKCKY